MKKETKKEKQYRRHRRVRAKIFGTAHRPRLCVFKSSKHIYAQIINDEKGRTLVAVSDQDLKSKTELPKEAKSLKEKKEEIVRAGKVAIAFEIGRLIAEKAINLPAGRQGNNIEKVVFDRAGYRYQGRVKALAEGAREGGLKF